MEQNQIQKIGFFNKIFYSCCKISRYPDMIKEGLKSAIYYMIAIIVIISLVLAGFSTYDTKQHLNKGVEYIQNNVAEFSIKDGDVTAEAEIIINNEEVVNLFSHVIVIDPYVSLEEAKNVYTKMETQYDLAVFLDNKVITINKDSKEVKEFEYKSVCDLYGFDSSKEINKQEVINKINSQTAFLFAMQFFMVYFLGYFITFSFFIFIVWVVGIITKAVLKKALNKKDVLLYAIYSMTAASLIFLIYMTICCITKVEVPFFTLEMIVLPSIYVIVGIKKIADVKENEEKQN